MLNKWLVELGVRLIAPSFNIDILRSCRHSSNVLIKFTECDSKKNVEWILIIVSYHIAILLTNMSKKNLLIVQTNISVHWNRMSGSEITNENLPFLYFAFPTRRSAISWNNRLVAWFIENCRSDVSFSLLSSSYPQMWKHQLIGVNSEHWPTFIRVNWFISHVIPMTMKYTPN